MSIYFNVVHRIINRNLFVLRSHIKRGGGPPRFDRTFIGFRSRLAGNGLRTAAGPVLKTRRNVKCTIVHRDVKVPDAPPPKMSRAKRTIKKNRRRLRNFASWPGGSALLCAAKPCYAFVPSFCCRPEFILVAMSCLFVVSLKDMSEQSRVSFFRRLPKLIIFCQTWSQGFSDCQPTVYRRSAVRLYNVSGLTFRKSGAVSLRLHDGLRVQVRPECSTCRPD